MKYPFFKGNKVIKLSDDDYFYFLIDAIKKAKKKIYATIFIVDPLKDLSDKVKKILDELSYAKWKGLTIKLVVGYSNKSFIIDMCGRATKKYCDTINIPTRFCNPPDDYSLHSKYIIIDDDLVIVGSHNWTASDIFSNTEESIAVYSKDTAINLTKEFDELWDSGMEVLQ